MELSSLGRQSDITTPPSSDGAPAPPGSEQGRGPRSGRSARLGQSAPGHSWRRRRTQPVEHEAAVVVGHLEGGLALDGGRVILHGGVEVHPEVFDLPAVIESGGEIAAGSARGDSGRQSCEGG